MEKIRVVFMGTPNFSVPILENLIKYTNVELVVTSPDAYIGRKKILTPCEVKKCAMDNNIQVHSPNKIKEDYQIIKAINPDVIITCAYGQIISKEILDIPKYGCINIHASLLPKYRGGAPIHHAIINGEEETGITLMYMDEGMDSGDIIISEKVQILPSDNIETLSNKLSLLGSEMIVRYLDDIINGKYKRIKQDESKVSFAPIITRKDEHIDFNDYGINIYNKIRALTPIPYANFILNNIEYKIIECELIKGNYTPNEIVYEDKESFIIGCKTDGIKISKIKPTGKSIMSVKDFKNGYKDALLGKEVL